MFVWRPGNPKSIRKIIETNLRFISSLSTDLTSWLLETSFSNYHTKRKESHGNPPLPYEIQTQRVWRASELPSIT